MKKSKGSKGRRFEDKVKSLINKCIHKKKYGVKRGSSGKGKVLKDSVQKEPDFLIVNKKSVNKKSLIPKIAIECKFISNKKSQAKYWTQFARGYTLLNDLKKEYPKTKCFLVFNREKYAGDKMDYYKLCKKIKIKFIDLKMDKKNFLREIKKRC